MNLVQPNIIEVNTIQGAKDYISQDGFFSTDYVLYTAAVARKCEAFSRVVDLTNEEKEILMMAAYLHNTGRFLEEMKSPIHQRNAYITLSELGWNNDVCLLVLHHLDAYGLRKLIAPSSTDNLFKEPLPERLSVLNDILTLSSLLTGPKGQRVTLEERVELGIQRYHASHVRVRHLLNLTRKAQSWLNNLFAGDLDKFDIKR